MNQTFFLQPLDVLMFRDGRPFGAGSEHTARCLFPPLPSTLYGAWRSALLSHSGTDIRRFAQTGEWASGTSETIRSAIGTPQSLGTLEIRDTGLMITGSTGHERFYPVPLDTIISPTGKRGTERASYMRPIRERQNIGYITDTPSWLSPCWLRSDHITGKGDGGGYVDSRQFQAIMENRSELPPAGTIQLRTEVEHRTGIARDRSSRGVRKGMIYTVQYRRVFADREDAKINSEYDAGFWVTLSGAEIPENLHLLRLGGDGRGTSVHRLSQPTLPIRLAPREGRLRIVLTTPAIFRQGWLPSWINEQTGTGTWKGLKLRLEGVCLGRPIPIGGFNLATNEPKPIMRGVPAGSVYFFIIEDGNASVLQEAFSISDERAQEGFGLFASGGYDHV